MDYAAVNEKDERRPYTVWIARHEAGPLLLPTAFCLLLSADCLLPTAYCVLPTAVPRSAVVVAG
ncbi:MAG: hypothetical protein DMG25_16800 [Acidobacteria bacterium]|nr:MAG: hypothetical protein DMG25_16800 [Acidobacteriota bacterium]